MNSRQDEDAFSPFRASGKRPNWATLTPPGPQQINAYRGFGNRQSLHLQGRVRAVGRESFAGARGSAADADDRVVTLQLGATRCSTTLSRLGYYSATIPVSGTVADGACWQNVLVIADTGHGALTARHRILVPDAQPRLLVICDLDGTVLPLRKETEGLPYVSRDPFAALCRALAGGVSGQRKRPVFCVSAHGWDRYQSCSQKLADAGLPEAPILLHPAPSPGTTMDYDASKSDHVEQILDTYPESPAVLFTTTAGLAPSALGRIITRQADRFVGVYATAGGSAQKHSDLSPLRAHCPGLIVGDDPVAAAAHAHQHGLLDDVQFAQLRAAPPQQQA